MRRSAETHSRLRRLGEDEFDFKCNSIIDIFKCVSLRATLAFNYIKSSGVVSLTVFDKIYCLAFTYIFASHYGEKSFKCLILKVPLSSSSPERRYKTSRNENACGFGDKFVELSLRGIRGCGSSDRSLPKLKWSRKPDPGMLRRRGLWRGTMLDPPQIIPPRRQHVDTFVHIAPRRNW